MNSTRLGTLAASVSAALAGLGLLVGCVEQPSPPPPVAVMPPPAPPPAPESTVVLEQANPPPPPAEPAQIMYLRETPPPPAHWKLIDRGGLAPLGHVILVDSPPPPPREEAIPRRPQNGIHQVWTGGHWRYYAGRYIWIPGKWMVPPVPRAIFVPAHWEKRGAEHVFIEGYWQL